MLCGVLWRQRTDWRVSQAGGWWWPSPLLVSSPGRPATNIFPRLTRYLQADSTWHFHAHPQHFNDSILNLISYVRTRWFGAGLLGAAAGKVENITVYLKLVLHRQWKSAKTGRARAELAENLALLRWNRELSKDVNSEILMRVGRICPDCGTPGGLQWWLGGPAAAVILSVWPGQLKGKVVLQWLLTGGLLCLAPARVPSYSPEVTAVIIQSSCWTGGRCLLSGFAKRLRFRARKTWSGGLLAASQARAAARTGEQAAACGGIMPSSHFSELS